MATTTKQAAFLSAIIEHRAEDWPRLQYADWLEEHGESERAEFIRVQMALAGQDPDCRCYPCVTNRHRERELLGAHEGVWLDWLKAAWGAEWVPARDCDVAWRRGFVAAITLSAEDWLRHTDALLAAAPIEEVTLTTWPRQEYVDSDMIIAYLPDVQPHTEVDVNDLPFGTIIVQALLEKRWPTIRFHLPGGTG